MDHTMQMNFCLTRAYVIVDFISPPIKQLAIKQTQK